MSNEESCKEVRVERLKADQGWGCAGFALVGASILAALEAGVVLLVRGTWCVCSMERGKDRARRSC